MATFEKLEVWQRSFGLSLVIHRRMKTCKDWSVRDQITRSADSIADNIAEGAEHLSAREFCRFLAIAKGSAGETRCQVWRIQALGILGSEECRDLIDELELISKMLNALIKALRNRIPT
ncbi:four helix bundle protein [Nibricoccus sp. IMCC34717]|uniref:four helix bundle protein n=1 Tax=Nibricoccus sp. IMCC34717 TaxID=3034021 RepID=UPI00384D0C15